MDDPTQPMVIEFQNRAHQSAHAPEQDIHVTVVQAIFDSAAEVWNDLPKIISRDRPAFRFVKSL